MSSIEVEILNCTSNPIEVISLAAGNCYGKSDISSKRVSRCIKSKHLSVLEHASVTFKISGISRACSHQLVRSRLASFCQQSQRYCKIDMENEDWYVTPPVARNIEDGGYVNETFYQIVTAAGQVYQQLLDCGLKPEDARYVLPECCKTEIVMTMNARELYHTFGMRLSNSAQWEIRNLFQEIKSKLEKLDGWDELIRYMEENNFEE